jgi:CotH kinase protein/Fn3 associated/Secretion system C-terminal sorting domain
MNKAVYTCCLLGLTLGAFAQNLQTIRVNIANGNDDIEVSTTKSITSSDLELGGFDGKKQYVALRFQNVLLPANAQVSNAYIQFTAKSGNPNTTTVNISCQQGNAPAYLTTENLLARPYVSNQIVWNSPAWFVTGESGPSQKTSNLATQINAAIATNWQSGNALSFILQGNATTNNVLNARSFEHNATRAGAPQLVVEYSIANGSNTINMADLTNIFVNEVAPKGTAALKEDWIELYNGNDVGVFTDSLYITGKKTQPFKWRLKNLRIPAKGFLRLIADKDTLLGFDHIDMKLSAAGEKFFLFKNVNGTPVELTSFEFPAIDVDNVTFGTITDGVLNPNVTNLVAFLGGTPNATNVGGKQFFKMSNATPRGIIQQPISVTLNAPADATIRYTTDFSQPSRTNGIIYTQPIAISNTTVLKTFAYTATGETVVENYTYINPTKGSELRFPNLVSQAAYETGLKHLPIVSISTSAGAADSKVEKICGFEYINKFGENASVSVLAGVEGYGNDSYLNSEQKNLRVKFKGIYGFSKLAYPIFEKDDADTKAPTTEFDVLELKIGQDGPNEDGYSMLMSSQGLVSKTMRELGNVDLHTRYVHAFVNGKYHGVYTLKEKYDQHLGATYYGGQKEQYDVIESSWTVGKVNEGNLTNWNALKTATAQNNFQTVKNYLNVPQFIDFMMVMMYFDNEWEYRAVADRNLVTTKFVFEDHDTDGALTKTIDENSYNYTVKWTDPAQVVFNGPAGMFGNLVRSNNKEFKTLVRDRVYEAMQLPNAPLTPSRIQTKLEALKTSLYPAFWMELARFNQTLYNDNPYFDEEYNGNIAHLPTRYQYNLNKWLAKGLAHTLSPVIFSQPSGNVTSAVTATNPNNQGIVYYTTNGTDPMGNDGVISAIATAYLDSLNLKTGVNSVVARVYLNGEWGPKAKVTYTNSATNLRLRNPIKAEFNDNKSFTIAPNPAYDYVDIDMTAAYTQSVELTIYNQLGEPLLKQSVEHPTDSYRFALDGLNTGPYILTIQVEGQGTIGRKLMINR